MQQHALIKIHNYSVDKIQISNYHSEKENGIKFVFIRLEILPKIEIKFDWTKTTRKHQLQLRYLFITIVKIE